MKIGLGLALALALLQEYSYLIEFAYARFCLRKYLNDALYLIVKIKRPSAVQ